MAEIPNFSHLVSLACHDLRTPLATVAGFASTLARDESLGAQQQRYVAIMEAAAAQMAELTDQLALVSRIEGDRYDPQLDEADTLELARAAAERLRDDRVSGIGRGASVSVDTDATERALGALALAALRHGGLERVELEAAGHDVCIGPVMAQAAPIVLGRDLRDFGAATSVRLVTALGGSVALEGDLLRVGLPPAASAKQP